MATTENNYIGNGTLTSYTFSFPYIKKENVRVTLDTIGTTDFTINDNTPTQVDFNTAPGNNVAIRIYRVTDNLKTASTFFAGSSIRAQDLNTNFEQALFIGQEEENKIQDVVAGGIADGSVTSAKIADGSVTNAKIANGSVTSAKIVDGSVTSAKIADGTIINADVNASAAIAGTKISPDFGSQAVTTTGLISADGKVSFPLGTAALPSLYPGSDTNTGIYSPGADQVAISTNGSERLRIDSSGNVLIGGTLPASPNITLASDGTGEFAGKLVSASTVSGDTGTTLATKDYVDSAYPGIPQNAQTSAYTLVSTDNGKHISITTGGVTVPSAVFSVGDTISIYNNSAADQTITQGASVTLRFAGTVNVGNRTLAQRGLVTVLCVGNNEFVISGGGLS